MKKICMIAVGGTISYIKGGSCKKSGKQILEEAGLTDDGSISIEVRDIVHKPSSDMQVEDLFEIAAEAYRAIDEGVDGIVITQGTDTIEETAFFMELILPNVVPVIVTGAMKHAALPGADGGANTKAAIVAASSELLRNEGCMVVFDEMILPAWYVKKTNTQSLDTFKSQFGLVGYFSEGKLRVVNHAVKPKFDYKFDRSVLDRKPAKVYIESMMIGYGGIMLDYIEQAGFGGVVIDGFGGGHCTTEAAGRIRKLINGMPVIMSSKTGSGEVLSETYSGYPGAETDLINEGVIYSGILDSCKARLLLILLLTEGKSIAEIRELFKKYSVFDY